MGGGVDDCTRQRVLGVEGLRLLKHKFALCFRPKEVKVKCRSCHFGYKDTFQKIWINTSIKFLY